MSLFNKKILITLILIASSCSSIDSFRQSYKNLLSSSDKSYIVQPGDSIWSIAIKYNLDYDPYITLNSVMVIYQWAKGYSLRDIYLRQSISLLYLEQIFLKLKKNDIVKSVRGTNGGYVLKRDPKNIKLSEIFQALDQKVKTVGCKKDSKKGCNGKSAKCITHELWDELEIYINNFFENKKLSDLSLTRGDN